MKTVKIMAIIALGFTWACGNSESTCLTDCASASLKNLNKCSITHTAYSSEDMKCNDLVMNENNQCNARCYGNL